MTDTRDVRALALLGPGELRDRLLAADTRATEAERRVEKLEDDLGMLSWVVTNGELSKPYALEDVRSRVEDALTEIGRRDREEAEQQLAEARAERDDWKRRYDEMREESRVDNERILQCIDAGWHGMTRAMTKPSLTLQDYVGDLQQRIATLTAAIEEAAYCWDALQMERDTITEDVKRYHAAMDGLRPALTPSEPRR